METWGYKFLRNRMVYLGSPKFVKIKGSATQLLNFKSLNPFMTEVPNLLIRSGFYMIGTFVMKELKN